MNTEEVREIFHKMRNTLIEKSSFHEEKMNIYETDRYTKTLNIALSKNLDSKLRTQLGWGKIAVDTLLNDVIFDGFKNDTMGFTKLLVNNGAIPAIESAQKNSMIGACSFVSVLPDAEGKPFFTAYSGKEATGIYDSRRGLVAGLAVNGVRRDSVFNIVKDYLLFTPGSVYKIEEGGDIISRVDMPTDKLLFIPFIYDQDVAVKPFGYSRYNKAFTTAFDTAVRGLKLIEMGNDVEIATRNILLTDSSPETIDDAFTAEDSNMSTLHAIFLGQGSTAQLEQLAGPDTDKTIKMISTAAVNAANAVFMKSTDFGYQPSNGSFSSDTLNDMNKPYAGIVRKCRNSYGESIKQIAIAAMSLMTGQYYEDWETIDPAFIDEVNPEKLGVIADGLQKLSLVAPEADFSEYINQKIFSGNVREKAMRVELPNFEASRKNAERFRYLESDIQNSI